MTNPDDPANAGVVTIPGYGPNRPVTLPNGETVLASNSEGLTKREYFAAMAMQGLMNCDETGTVLDAEFELGIPKGTYNYKKHWPMIVALRACGYADALIAELNKEKGREAR